MYKKTITYTDYNGTERTESFYFHLDEDELMDMNLEFEGGFEEKFKKIVETNNVKEMVALIKDFIKRSYGIKSEDGRTFDKKPEYFEDFRKTPAYGVLYMDILSSEEKSAEFFNNLVPASLKAKADKIKSENPAVLGLPSSK